MYPLLTQTRHNSNKPVGVIAFWPRAGCVHAKSIAIFHSAFFFFFFVAGRKSIHDLSIPSLAAINLLLKCHWGDCSSHCSQLYQQSETPSCLLYFSLPVHAQSNFSLSLWFISFFLGVVARAPWLRALIYLPGTGRLNMPCSHLKRCHCAGGAGACCRAPINPPDAHHIRAY